MTREELEKTLHELKSQLEETDLADIDDEAKETKNLAEPENKDADESIEEIEYKDEEKNSDIDNDKRPVTMADITRDKLKDAISSGRLESALERAAGSFDFAKATATCFSQIAQKTRENMEGDVEGSAGSQGISITSDMWIPMLINMMQTNEFQCLVANMLVKIVS